MNRSLLVESLNILLSEDLVPTIRRTSELRLSKGKRVALRESKGIEIKKSEVIKECPGYVLKKEIWDMSGSFSSQPIEMVAAYSTKDGSYIGDQKNAEFYCDQRGIFPEKSHPDNSVASIGFCPKEQKWYGWSHRAIFGFKVGDVVEAGDCCAGAGPAGEPFENGLPVGFEAKTLEDCKLMAIAFADSVS